MTGHGRAPPTPLVDGLGRRVSYLRLSVVDACTFRCTYCSPAPRRGAAPALGLDEIRVLVRVLAGMGVCRVRLTGGEPTLRGDLARVAEAVAAVAGVEEVALTTNGTRLEALAAPLRAAGISRVNVSLDTLHADRLRALSGPAARLERVLAGLRAAAAAGFAVLKSNTVVIRGVNDDELGDILRFAWRLGAVPRLIELMPFGAGDPVPVAEMKRLLEAQDVRLAPDDARGWGPAVHLRGVSSDARGPCGGVVGFIGAMSECFCAGCNRIRVAADGTLLPCLGGRVRVPLRPLLRAGAEAELEVRVRGALREKRERHDLAAAAAERALPAMCATGG